MAADGRKHVHNGQYWVFNIVAEPHNNVYFYNYLISNSAEDGSRSCSNVC